MFFFPKGPLYFWCSFLSHALRYDQLSAYEKKCCYSAEESPQIHEQAIISFIKLSNANWIIKL